MANGEEEWSESDAPVLLRPDEPGYPDPFQKKSPTAPQEGPR